MMKRLIFLGIIILGLAGISIAGDNSCYYIDKSYGNMKINSHNGNCMKVNYYQNLLPDFYTLRENCSAEYSSFIDSNGKGEKPVKVGIMKFSNDLYIKHFLLLSRKNRLENYTKIIENGNMLSIDYREYSNLLWISDNIIFSIYSHNEVDTKPMLTDYLAKYPPTVQFTKEDFDLKELRRKEMDKFFDIFMEAEKLRVGEKAKEKYVQYIGTMAQCNVEMMTRCYAGIQDGGTYISCPVSLELDAEKRMSGFEALKKEAELKGFVLEDAQRILCPAIGLPSVMLPAMKKLGMTDDDLYKLQESGAPKEFLPRIE